MNKLIITNSYAKLEDLNKYYKGISNVLIEKVSTPEEFEQKVLGYSYQCYDLHGSFKNEKDLDDLISLLERGKLSCDDPKSWEAIVHTIEPFREDYHDLKAVEFNGEIEVKPLIKKHPILKYFKYDHLPERLQEVSKQFSDIAYDMDKRDLDADEKTAGLRKLLEAKDCFVRGGV